MNMKNRCLTDEEMTSYVDGVVGDGLRKKIEAHLSACPVCLHNVAELKELVSPEAETSKPVPENALARAESLNALADHLWIDVQGNKGPLVETGIEQTKEFVRNVLPEL